MIVLVLEHVGFVRADKVGALLGQTVRDGLGGVRFCADGHVAERGPAGVRVDAEIAPGRPHRGCWVGIVVALGEEVVLGGSWDTATIKHFRCVLGSRFLVLLSLVSFCRFLLF